MTFGTPSPDTEENRESRKCFVEDEEENFLDSFFDAYSNAPIEFLKTFSFPSMPLKYRMIFLALIASVTAGITFVDRAIPDNRPKGKNIESVINQEYQNKKSKLNSAYKIEYQNEISKLNSAYKIELKDIQNAKMVRDSIYQAKADSLKKVYENKLEKELK